MAQPDGTVLFQADPGHDWPEISDDDDPQGRHFDFDRARECAESFNEADRGFSAWHSPRWRPISSLPSSLAYRHCPPLPLHVIPEPPAIPSPRAAVGPPSLTCLFLRVHLPTGRRTTAPPHLNLPPPPSSFPPPMPPPSFLCSVSVVPHTVRPRDSTSTSHPAAVVRRSPPPRHPPPSPSLP